VDGAEVTAVKDQHTFVRLPESSGLEVGDVVRLGLSHPCTAFDKWTMLPVLDDATGPDPAVVDLVRTFF
jgi:D-serine deaminase-like pyridoxal phosphate-dependent protein